MKQTRLIVLLPVLTAILLGGSKLQASRAGPPWDLHQQESGPGWTLLAAPDAGAGDRFGYSAALDGDYLAAGAPGGVPIPDAGDNTASGERYPEGTPGSVYVFQRLGETWSDPMKLTTADIQPGEQFGLRVALSADTLAVSAPYAWTNSGGNATGAVYVFQRQGDAWTQQARLSAPDGAHFDLFGSALALQGNTLAVGARGADLPGERNAGAVYVFQRSGEAWSLQAKLASDDSAELDYFGEDLILTGETLLVGSPGHDERVEGDNYGAVYRFRRRGGSWQQVGMLSSPDLAPNAQFGSSLALDEPSGALAIFAQTEGPAPNLEEQGLQGIESFVNYAGTVHVFESRGDDWAFQARLTPEQFPYYPFYFLRTGKVAAGGSEPDGSLVGLSMSSIGFYGSALYQRQGDQWIERSLPENIYQATGMHSLPILLDVDKGVLVFGSLGLSEPGSAILLVEVGEWGDLQ